MTFGGSLGRNIDFEVVNFQLLVKTRRKRSIFELQLVKIEGSLARHAFSRVSLHVPGCAMSVGEVAKPFVWEGVKVSKLEEFTSRTTCSFEASTCVVSGFRLSFGSPESVGEAAETICFKV